MYIIKAVFATAQLTVVAALALAQYDVREYPGSDFDGPAFVFEEVAEDIYHARGTGKMLVGSNTAIIVNDDDVMVVDSNISAVSAAALAQEFKAISDKPIRYVINTHFHFDHAHGNQIYPADVHIIGHEFTYEMLANGGSVGRSYRGFADWINGVPGGAEGQEGLRPTTPNTTLSETMTLFRGDREIQLLYLGRGHTGGDVVVFLPAEKILITGDLLLEGVPFMGDAYPSEWIGTLEKLKALDFDIVMPGHGTPFRDRSRIGHQQDLLATIYESASSACGRKLDATDAAAGIDLTGHAAAYPEIKGVGAPLAVVERIYELGDCAP